MHRFAVFTLALGGALFCASCSSSRGGVPPERGRVYNAIDFGLISSTYFVVSRVDGTPVHRKFDRDTYVDLMPGRHELRVRFYSESLTEGREGADECALDLQVEAGGEYYLEGAVGGEGWRARVLTADRTTTPCVFASGASAGRVHGGAQPGAVSALPASSPSAAAESVEKPAVAAPAVVVAPPVAPAQPGAAPAQPVIAPAQPVVAPAEPGRSAVASRPAAPGAIQAAAVAAAAPGGTPAAAPAPAAAGVAPPAEPTWPAAGRSEDELFIVSAMRGRGHDGCRAGRYRVSGVRGEVIAIGGAERVRLLGVQPRTEDAFDRALDRLVGACVAIELDTVLTEAAQHDRDGNLLAYLRDERGELINAEVIRRGVATVDTTLRHRYLGELLAAQAAADSAAE